MPSTRSGRTKGPRPVQSPKPSASPGRRYWRYVWPAVVVVAALVAFLIARQQASSPAEAVEPPASGLPDTPDYHSLLVAPDDPDRLWLGTHAGLHESSDGGRSWSAGSLTGRDAMNLVRSSDETVWTAGHLSFARSDDGGATWTALDPEGLPSLDIHGFARDPQQPGVLYAAVAGEGLYRSADAGASFELVSSEVGGEVFGLAVLDGGRLLAGDLGRGLVSSDDDGRSWTPVEEIAALGLSVNPGDPETIAAAGQGASGAGVFLSRDGGSSWKQVLDVPQGAGPLAWSASDPSIGYVVGFDKRLYRTADAGASWRPVGA